MKASILFALAAAVGSPARFEIPRSPIELTGMARPGVYCEASGPRAALLGSEEGAFEAWIYPFKILHGLRLSVVLPGGLNPIPLSDLAREVTVRPESTTLLFSHMAFTLRLTAFIPIDLPAAVLLLDLSSSRPITLYADFRSDLAPMWPGGLGGQWSVWEGEKRAFLLSESRRKYAAYFGSPEAGSGTDLPAHNLPDAPTRMVLEVSPQEAASSFIPIVIAGSVEGAGGRAAPERAWETYLTVLREMESLYRETARRHEVSRNLRLRVESPDPEINRAFEWASVALEKLRVCHPQLGCGLVAGLGRSGLSLRPGFGWFFGGDTFINSVALVSLGEFDLAREAMELVRKNQRADGKMMHELSQAAALIPWFEDYPYAYYHADTTPYYLAALHDYLRASGDLSYLETSWDSAVRAYRYCLTADSDGDGLMENAIAGLGAIETGKLLGNLHTEIYLGSLWTRALESLSEMAGWRGDRDLAREARERAARARRSLNERFYEPSLRRHIFALTEGGKAKSSEATAWPAVGIAIGVLEEAAGELDLLASEEMSSDWGVRMLSRSSPSYDPLAYNNGSVWPFLTGFASWAHYARHRAQAGWQALLSNARLTAFDALGYHPELLSGDLYQTIETSVPHQGFSSFGVIAPLARGLLGLETDSLSGTLHLAPHLPVSWERLSLRQVRMKDLRINLDLERGPGRISLRASPARKLRYALRFAPALSAGSRKVEARIDGRPLPVNLLPGEPGASDIHAEVEVKASGPVSLEFRYVPGPELEIPVEAPQVGSETSGLKLIRATPGSSSLSLVLEGRGGKSYVFFLHHAPASTRVDGAELAGREGSRLAFSVRFEGPAYQRKEVRLSW